MAGGGRTVTVVAVSVLGCLLIWWGAAAGDPLLRPPSSTLNPPDITRASASPSIPEPTEPPPQAVQEEGVAQDVGWLVYAVIAAALLLIALIVRALLRRRGAPQAPPREVPDELDVLVEATSQRSLAAAMAEGDPRNAVVACWVALEDGVERAGLDRSPAETSEDLTARVLGQWQVDQGAISRLAGLYREARFSRHPMTEADRDAAREALDRISSGLRAAARARAQAEADAGAQGEADAAAGVDARDGHGTGTGSTGPEVPR